MIYKNNKKEVMYDFAWLEGMDKDRQMRQTDRQRNGKDRKIEKTRNLIVLQAVQLYCRSRSVESVQLGYDPALSFATV